LSWTPRFRRDVASVSLAGFLSGQRGSKVFAYPQSLIILTFLNRESESSPCPKAND